MARAEHRRVRSWKRLEESLSRSQTPEAFRGSLTMSLIIPTHPNWDTCASESALLITKLEKGVTSYV